MPPRHTDYSKHKVLYKIGIDSLILSIIRFLHVCQNKFISDTKYTVDEKKTLKFSIRISIHAPIKQTLVIYTNSFRCNFGNITFGKDQKQYTQEACVIYRSKLESAGTSLKFWGIVDTYIWRTYIPNFRSIGVKDPAGQWRSGGLLSSLFSLKK